MVPGEATARTADAARWRAGTGRMEAMEEDEGLRARRIPGGSDQDPTVCLPPERRGKDVLPGRISRTLPGRDRR